ncbi:helix-hairpin-helix domain-containing protein [Ferruginibacter sp.]|uniref:helix-hairpin-helix domain-containing protein n=1 Tax=Ferruginibacter sp. TaxID=1940288 RepID=UPI001988EF27|nr:helix-hairpin-helix domain-containing protein [Ferruginibacter sp.]MBC7627706.1 helix-hairpin-helix domain-containing protein [Ferruginibacter sp.]
MVQPNSNVEQQLENITENSADAETEDDSYLQEMIQYQKHPININTASASLLSGLRILSPIQVQNIIDYRTLLGNFVNIYELQAVPGFDIAIIQRLRPYIAIVENADLFASLNERLKNGDKTILLRFSQIVEPSKGYLVDPNSGKNFYRGSPQRLLVRYRYNYKNSLQYGIVGEKDGGEQFFKGAQKQGFDFYSFHFFAKNIGIIKSLAIGDYTVNMGQGLTQWMSLAFKKSPDILSIKRQADVLRPYNSAGEINFHRGVGITLAKKNWEGTFFASYRNVDANFSAGDSSQTQDDFISSLQISGFHRTKSEVADKGIQRQLAFGGNIAYQLKSLHVGLNAIHYSLKYPLQKQAEPYNFYALAGKSFGNYSTDYSYTKKNLHFFGEAAITNKKYTGFINGLLISTAANVDMSFVYRNISKGYQSLYTNAFTENSYPTNEKGFFSGITIKPTDAWRIDGYVDLYKFPWLKFRVNAPSSGSDYVGQITYKPNKLFEIYTRFKSEKKSINYNPDELILSPVVPQPRQNWRTQFSYKLNSTFTFRSRIETVWFDKNGKASENGFLMYTDVLYNPGMKKMAGNIRLQYFETDGYNSRLYAYENDVLYSFSIPVFYGKGYRYYINLNYDFTKKLTIWVRVSQSIYPNQTNTGSSLDEINKNHKTELKMQALFKF